MQVSETKHCDFCGFAKSLVAPVVVAKDVVFAEWRVAICASCVEQAVETFRKKRESA